MIDYLFCFESEAQAAAALPTFRTPAFPAEKIPAAWDGSRVLVTNIQVGTKPVGTDPETKAPILAPVYAQGYWLAISTPTPDDALYAIPACMREADRDAAEAGKPYVLRQRFSAEQLASDWDLSRQWLGTDYSNEGP